MRTIRTKVYKFAELSEQAQSKAVEKLNDINTDYNWFEPYIEDAIETLKGQGFLNAEIFFSGFSSQGDGASFNADVDSMYFAITPNEKRVCKLIEAGLIDNFEVCKNSYSHHYSHEKTRYVDINGTGKNNIDKVLSTMCEGIEDKRLQLSREIYRDLEKAYDYLCSKESIIETIEANEYEFTADGRRI